VRGRPEAIAERRQALVVDVLDLAAARVDAVDRALIDVDSDDLVAGFGERDGQRQPHVAEPDDPDLHPRQFRRRPAGRSAVR
jgi:hypothetical protein